ncbi:MAG: hypothetical protein JST55_05610 [Bacteroidetes bacterium]|nr:hypothetical protein [Bacteroidota bacterium]
MKKFILLIGIFFCANCLFAQTYNSTLDKDTTGGILKHLLYVYCDSNKFTDTNHMNKVIDYLSEKNCMVNKIYLNDWMNSDLINFFKEKNITCSVRSVVNILPVMVIRISDEQDVKKVRNTISDGVYILNAEYYAFVYH